MKRTTSYVLITALMLLTGVPAHTVGAETTVNVSTEVTTETGVRKPDPKPLPPKTVMEARKEIKDARAEVRGEVKAIRKEVKAEIKGKREEQKEEVKDLRDKMASTTKAVRGEAIQNRVGDMLQKMNVRFEATITREESIMAKLNVRIEKIKAEGKISTVVAEKLAAEAKTHFDEAREALTALQTISTSASASAAATSTIATVGKPLLQNLNKGAQEVEKHLRKGHLALEKALLSFKVGVKSNATTTPTN